MIDCIWKCLKKLPWWAWIILVLAGVIVALLTFFISPILFPEATITIIAGVQIPLWIKSAIAGVAGTVGATIIKCINNCKG